MTHGMAAFGAVFLGAGIGGMLRHGVNGLTLRLLGFGFPYGTLLVNVLGSLVMGLLVGWFAHKGDPGMNWKLFLTTGLLGGFTTFSTFSLDVVTLYQRGALVSSGMYVLGSVALSLAALLAGLVATRHLL